MCFMNDWFVVWRRDGSVAVWAPRVVQRVRSPQDLSAVLGSSPPSSGTEDCGFCGRVSRGAVHALVTVPASRTNPCEWAWQVEAVALLSPPLEESNGPRKIWSQLVEGYYLKVRVRYNHYWPLISVYTMILMPAFVNYWMSVDWSNGMETNAMEATTEEIA